MDAFIGTILPWAGTYAPQGWLFCQGQTLPVNQYAAVFAVLGTTYGGNGSTNFMLPNLQGRIPVGAGTLPGTTTTTFKQGAVGGVISANLPANYVAAHTHTASISGLGVSANFGLRVSTNTANQIAPPTDATSAANYGLAKSDNPDGGTNVNVYKDISNDGSAVVKLKSYPCDVNLTSGTVTVNPNTSTAGTVQVLQPYQVINYIICLEGIFPSRP